MTQHIVDEIYAHYIIVMCVHEIQHVQLFKMADAKQTPICCRYVFRNSRYSNCAAIQVWTNIPNYWDLRSKHVADSYG